MPERLNFPLTQKTLRSIENRDERTFAKACLKKPNLKVTCHVQVEGRNIDFHVKNTNVNGHSQGVLVEINGKNWMEGNKWGQQRAMKRSGLANTILFGWNLGNIRHHLQKNK